MKKNKKSKIDLKLFFFKIKINCNNTFLNKKLETRALWSKTTFLCFFEKKYIREILVGKYTNES